jgi:hypothetical protein
MCHHLPMTIKKKTKRWKREKALTRKESICLVLTMQVLEMRSLVAFCLGE